MLDPMVRHSRAAAIAMTAALAVTLFTGCGIKGPLKPAPKPEPQGAAEAGKPAPAAKP